MGTEPLAGLALAASVLLFVTALCSFLAYGTTPRVARARGANDPRSAAAVGVQSLWLGVLLGLPLAAALALFARPVVQLLGGEGAALDAAVTYLRISAIVGSTAVFLVVEKRFLHSSVLVKAPTYFRPTQTAR